MSLRDPYPTSLSCRTTITNRRLGNPVQEQLPKTPIPSFTEIGPRANPAPNQPKLITARVYKALNTSGFDKGPAHVQSPTSCRTVGGYASKSLQKIKEPPANDTKVRQKIFNPPLPNGKG
ncbi:unnamed protein product [Prunus armeniaca]|uniref:Uncharacterized protein n=1 Tax=Prunus armeniaca TaxID=36596 RepID=A0A6J5UT49_PRUAR|nr:unnamed protein product [Prunus armeniaca]